ncbi:MAG: M48 family metalloprotease [Desulfotignum sp.]|nr:M48 family metalloprotease [Desulfobacteraceae bacterium]
MNDEKCQKATDPLLNRRQFLRLSTMVSAAGLFHVYGCAMDPVTGKSQLMMLSPGQEIAIDRQQSPFQFSSDFGITQDQALNQYINQVGKNLVPHVHRPDMPYNFQCVNATYINAYAFPGGSIAVTRGILLSLDNEAELAALLGHELGHVNARHTAEQVSKSQLSSLVVGGLAILADSQAKGLGNLTQQLGALGQGLYLAKYSRENEREADFLGHEYMVGAGYGSKGFVGLMEMLNTLNKQQPTSAQMLFSTHPMSDERLTAAVQRDQGTYAATRNSPVYKERYMDHTAGLRRRKKAILAMQEGEKYMAQEKYDKARASFASAIYQAKDDYAAHVLMARCLLIQEKAAEAASYATAAIQLYPEEPQGHYMAGLAHVGAKQFSRALDNFTRCDQLLPGNPQLTFYKGYCRDKMGRQRPAANDYEAYLKMINYQSNQYSQYAVKRLKEWGYAQ